MIMSHGQSVQHIPAKLPLGHELIHQGHEAGIVRWFNQVNHFVNDYVFKTLPRLLGEVSIQANCAGGMIAASPFCFHSPHKKSLHFHLHQLFPFCNQRRSRILDQLTIPFFQDGLLLFTVCTGAHFQKNAIVT